MTLIPMYCRPTGRRFIDTLVFIGKIPEANYGVQWTAPKFESVDPLNDAMGTPETERSRIITPDGTGWRNQQLQEGVLYARGNHGDSAGDQGPEFQVERFTVAATFAPPSANDDARTIDAVWYTGAKVPRFDWRSGEEYDLILDMKGCRMDRLNNGGPVLDLHSAYGVESQLDVVRKAWARNLPPGHDPVQQT